MAKLWKFLAISVVLAVCLGLALGPGVPGALAADTPIGIEVVPQETKVGFNEDFEVEVWINDTGAWDYNACGVRLTYETKYVTCNAVTDSGIWDYTANCKCNNTWNTSAGLGLVIFDAALLGSTFNTSQKVLTANFTSNTSNGGISGLDFIFIWADDATSVPDAGVDQLNWTRVVNGTVIIGDVFNLTVTSDGCCPITVGGLGTVAANSNGTFMVPCPSVTLTANASDVCCVFDNWTVDAGAPNSSNPIVVTGAANSSHTAVASCSVPQYNLTMNVTGNGTTTPSGTSSHSCGEVVNISATADPDWQFVNWTTADMSEIANATAASTTVTVDKEKTVTANFAEITGATLEGHVSFTGRGTAPDSRWIEPFNVTLFEAGNLSNVIWTGNATTNDTGVFNITGLDPGTYDIGIKNWTCLSEVNTSVTLTAGNTTAVGFGTTREGDIDNSDWVYLGDLSAFCTAWDTKPGDGGWNADADLDRDDWVYLGDLSLFCTNWDQKGDAYGYFV